MPQHPALAAIFDSISLGEPICAGGWALFPMFPLRRPEVRLISLRAAVLRGLARVEERPDGGSVRELCVHTASHLPVLLRDGDLFSCGKQDRIADRPMLLAANSVTEVPVSCVEAGRWAHDGRTDFDVAPFDADLPLRYARRAETPVGERPDQHRTWARVATHRGERGMSDPSGSLLASLAQPPMDTCELVDELPPVYGATGLALCRSTPQGPRVAELAWYADPTLCEETWQAVVMGAASSLPAGPRPPTISRTELRALFAQLCAARGECHDELLSLRYGRTHARALLSHGNPVYLNAIHA